MYVAKCFCVHIPTSYIDHQYQSIRQEVILELPRVETQQSQFHLQKSNFVYLLKRE